MKYLDINISIVLKINFFNILYKYCNTDTVVQGKMLDAMNYGFDMIQREKWCHEEVQDPLEIQGNYMFRKGGPHNKIEAELALV